MILTIDSFDSNNFKVKIRYIEQHCRNLLVSYLLRNMFYCFKELISDESNRAPKMMSCLP